MLSAFGVHFEVFCVCVCVCVSFTRLPSCATAARLIACELLCSHEHAQYRVRAFHLPLLTIHFPPHFVLLLTLHSTTLTPSLHSSNHLTPHPSLLPPPPPTPTSHSSPLFSHSSPHLSLLTPYSSTPHPSPPTSHPPPLRCPSRAACQPLPPEVGAVLLHI